jgi:hypothetical protein
MMTQEKIFAFLQSSAVSSFVTRCTQKIEARQNETDTGKSLQLTMSFFLSEKGHELWGGSYSRCKSLAEDVPIPSSQCRQ